jgi:hypothetical protein
VSAARSIAAIVVVAFPVAFQLHASSEYITSIALLGVLTRLPPFCPAFWPTFACDRSGAGARQFGLHTHRGSRYHASRKCESCSYLHLVKPGVPRTRSGSRGSLRVPWVKWCVPPRCEHSPKGRRAHDRAQESDHPNARADVDGLRLLLSDGAEYRW